MEPTTKIVVGVGTLAIIGCYLFCPWRDETPTSVVPQEEPWQNETGYGQPAQTPTPADRPPYLKRAPLPVYPGRPNVGPTVSKLLYDPYYIE